MQIPDHINVIGAMPQGGQMRFNVSAGMTDVHIFGRIRLHGARPGSVLLALPLDRDASAVRCARARIGLGFRTWTVQDRLGEGNLCAYRAVGLRRSDRSAVENHGVAARLEGWPEQRDLRLSLYVLDCGSAERASDQVAAQMDRDIARVRSVLADRKQVGITTIARDGIGERDSWHRCDLVKSSQ